MRGTLTKTTPFGMRGLWPLAKAIDYAEIFIYDEARQEAALSDIAILGALPLVTPSRPQAAPGLSSLLVCASRCCRRSCPSLFVAC